MKTHPYRGALLGGLILSLGISGLQAQETSPPPPPKERPAPTAEAPEGVRAERIRQRIQDLRAAGKHEEADQMVERMKQASSKRTQSQTAARTPRGKADGKEDRKAHAGHPERKGPPQPTEPPPVMKIRNLNMAAGLLDAAGYRDHAEKARQEAGRIEGEMRKAEQMKDRPDPAAGMREEMQKLRREVEELRGQIRNLRVESESRPERGRREENRPH